MRRATFYDIDIFIITWAFQSTLSVRRATRAALMRHICLYLISIHALREESDLGNGLQGYMQYNFNPRSPWGERRKQCGIDVISISISIHALREESDVTGLLATILQTLFQSTLSVRRATITACTEVAIIINFNPRSPWGERHKQAHSLLILSTISIHALREESDQLILLL